MQSLSHRHHTWYERLEDASSHPVGGIVIALLVLFATFWFVRFVGEGMISYIGDPFFERAMDTSADETEPGFGTGKLLAHHLDR